MPPLPVQFRNSQPQPLKLGRGLCPFCGRQAGSPSNTKSPGWGLRPCQVPASSIQPFSRNKHGPKIWGEGSALLLGRGAGSSSNTNSPGLRPTSVPSGILMHPAVRPQQIWAKNWGAVPLWGSWVPIWHYVAGAKAYLHAKFHLDPSNCLATIHQRHRQDRTGQDRQTDRQQDNGLIA